MLARKKAHSINVDAYEEFPAIDDALEWLETYGGGKYFVKPLSLEKCRLGYYEFEVRIKNLKRKKNP